MNKQKDLQLIKQLIVHLIVKNNTNCNNIIVQLIVDKRTFVRHYTVFRAGLKNA